MKIEGECPHCKKDVAIDIDKLEVKQEPVQTLNNATTTQILEQKPQQEPKEIVKEKTIIKRPSYLPRFHCKNCGDLHKNPDYKKKVTHRCADGNCGQFTANPKKPCTWCGNTEFEELDEDTLSMIPDPDHDHEDEE